MSIDIEKLLKEKDIAIIYQGRELYFSPVHMMFKVVPTDTRHTIFKSDDLESAMDVLLNALSHG